MSDLPLEAASLLVAAILFAAHFAAEALVRRGRAKRMVRTPFEGHSTLLVTALGLAAVLVAAAARPLLSWVRFAPRPGVVALLDGLAAALGDLDGKERLVMTLRYGLDDDEPRTLQEIGHRMRLSRERVRQIESRAKEKLRRSAKLRSHLN